MMNLLVDRVYCPLNRPSLTAAETCEDKICIVAISEPFSRRVIRPGTACPATRDQLAYTVSTLTEEPPRWIVYSAFTSSAVGLSKYQNLARCALSDRKATGADV